MRNVVPRSTEELIKIASHEKITTNTKNAVKWYIDSFLNTEGANRSLTASVTSQSLQYITDKSLSGNPSFRQVQLAELYNDLRHKVPAILVSDTGISVSPMRGINPLEGASHIEGNTKWLGRHFISRLVGVGVTAITAAKSDANDLVSLLGIIFDELRNISHLGNVIHGGHIDEQAKWVLQLPMTYQQLSAQPMAMQDDETNRDQLWSAEITFDANYQAWFDIQVDIEDNQTITGVIETTPDQMLKFQMDDTTNLGKSLVWVVPGYLPNRNKIAVDDFRIATVDLDTRLLHPRRVGTVNILLMDNNGVVLDQKPITVTAT